jgi:putative FmdB family regulatory protein
MSIYDYQCDACGHVQEEMHGMKESPEIKCSECQGTMRKLISGGTGFILKGDGFYSTSQRFKESMTKKTLKQGEKAKNHVKPVTKISDLGGTDL